MNKEVRGDTEWYYTTDNDGDRYYEQPKTWGLSKAPESMNSKELSAAIAKELLGCSPRWSKHYADWCCTCKGGPHMIDQQCSVIDDYANKLTFMQKVAVKKFNNVLIPVDMLSDPQAIGKLLLTRHRSKNEKTP